MLLGCKLIPVSEVANLVEQALKDMDVNKDDYVSVRELVDYFKNVLKRY